VCGCTVNGSTCRTHQLWLSGIAMVRVVWHLHGFRRQHLHPMLPPWSWDINLSFLNGHTG
jgi:hypothetical protein